MGRISRRRSRAWQMCDAGRFGAEMPAPRRRRRPCCGGGANRAAAAVQMCDPWPQRCARPAERVPVLTDRAWQVHAARASLPSPRAPRLLRPSWRCCTPPSSGATPTNASSWTCTRHDPLRAGHADRAHSLCAHPVYIQPRWDSWWPLTDCAGWQLLRGKGGAPPPNPTNTPGPTCLSHVFSLFVTVCAVDQGLPFVRLYSFPLPQDRGDDSSLRSRQPRRGLHIRRETPLTNSHSNKRKCCHPPRRPTSACRDVHVRASSCLHTLRQS